MKFVPGNSGKEVNRKSCLRGTREIYTFDDLRRWQSVTAEVQPPLRLAVMGDPVAHSASPPMHNAALAAENIPARYTRLHVNAERLAEAFGLLPQGGFIGVNLTIPHKVVALPLLDSVDEAAALLGAVNTVSIGADGKLRGFNTDGPGFVRAVQAEFGVGLRGMKVIIFGAGGGAGRALVTQCVIEGCAGVILVNRTVGRAHALAEEIGAKMPNSPCELTVLPWQQAVSGKELDSVDLMVNASSVGLQPSDHALLSAENIPSHLRVFDTVYRRDGRPTSLLAAAREAGALATGGLTLLLHQGALAFERWFERPAPLEIMRAALGNAAAPSAGGPG